MAGENNCMLSYQSKVLGFAPLIGNDDDLVVDAVFLLLLFTREHVVVVASIARRASGA